MKKWTRYRLLVECRKVLKTGVKDLIQYRALRYERAHSLVKTSSYTCARKLDSIKVDPFQMGQLEGVIHELIHFVERKELKAYDDELEESTVLAHQALCVEWIQQSERRVKSWRKLIEQSLKEKPK